jgi:hypothetical protein
MNSADLDELKERLAVERDELIQDLARRQRALETDHAHLMAETEETLARARAAEPLIYKQTDSGGSAASDGDGDGDEELIEIVAQALALKAVDARDELEAALRPIREEIMRLREQVQALMDSKSESLRTTPALEKRPVAPPRLLMP